MKEIGGYIEFEQYHGSMLHEDGIKLDCGRSCLGYLFRAKGIQKLAAPYWMCDSVFETCRQYGVQVRFYSVGLDLRPENVVLDTDEWLYLMNYYGQLTAAEISSYRDTYRRVIVDDTQDYFTDPVKGVDTIYSCRKYFGVPDGAILYTDAIFEGELEQSESFENMQHLLGRFERSASEFYRASAENNQRFKDQPIRKMSKLTENLLHSLEYERIQKKRDENYGYLAAKLSDKNMLRLRPAKGAFAYPFMTEDAATLRKKLIENKIYVPILWPNVIEQANNTSTEFRMANDVLPLPCDQRYGVQDMETICSFVFNIERIN